VKAGAMVAVAHEAFQLFGIDGSVGMNTFTQIALCQFETYLIHKTYAPPG
jgi:hypothetical protein